MRIVIPDLLPGTDYAIQVRADNGDGESVWSPRFEVTTAEDTTLPKVPTNVTWVVSGDSFYGEWDSIDINVNNNYALITRYELELVGNGVTKVVAVPQKTGSRIGYTLTFEDNRALFNNPAATVTMRVRAVDNKNLKGAYSAIKSATNPAPNPVTNLTATGITDAVNLNWTPPTDNDLIGYNIYASVTSGFNPTGSNKVGSTAGTQFQHTTSNYTTWHYVVRSVDKFGSESTMTRVTGTPLSPFTIDTEAPPVPTGLAAAIHNNPAGTSASATVTWSMPTPVPADLGGFTLRFRKVGNSAWEQSMMLDADLRSLVVPLNSIYSNYEFEIRAYDYNGNYSDWSARVTATAPANAAPPQVTGLAVTAGLDSLNISWTESTATDVKAGAGTYEVQVATNSSFTTGLLTYRTGSTNIAINALAKDTTFYVRVRATDSGGLSGAWSTTVNKKTEAIVIPEPSDGFPPSASPTPTVTAGIGNLHVRWAPVTTNSNGGAQEDLVIYEVHTSTTSGFAPSAATKAEEVAGTSVVLKKNPNGSNMSYGTTYYVKVIAKDTDGAAAASGQASGVPAKVTSGDSTITAGDLGAATTTQLNQTNTNVTNVSNLAGSKSKFITSTSDASGTVGSDGIAYATGDVWQKRDASGNIIAQWKFLVGTGWQSEQVANGLIANLSVGKLISGTIDSAEVIISSTGHIRSSDYSSSNGWKISNSGGIELRKGTVYANTLESGTGIVKNLIIASGGAIQSSVFNATTGFKISNLGIEMNDANSKVSAAALTGGTISGKQFIVGAGGSFILDSTGYMQSNNYSAGVSGWKLYTAASGAAAFELNSGSVRLETLKGGKITGKTFEVDTGGMIQSVGYTGASGFRLSSSGLEVKTGAIEAAALKIQNSQNLLPPQYADFEWGDSYYVNPFWDARGQGKFSINLGLMNSNESTAAPRGKRAAGWTTFSDSGEKIAWLGANSTDYNIAVDEGATYIFSIYMKNLTQARTWYLRAINQNGTVFATSSAINMPASMTSFVRYQFKFTIPAGTSKIMVGLRSAAVASGGSNLHFDAAQVERVEAGLEEASPWKPPAATTIEGAGIITGFLRSQANINVNGTNFPLWSINLDGNAQFGDAAVRGKLLVGPAGSTDGGNSYIASGNYVANDQGWKIKDDGIAEFSNITSRAPGGTRIDIGNAVNPFQSNQEWNMLQFFSSNSAWSPAQIWVNYLSGNPNGGVMLLTSPKLGSRQPAQIQLWSEEQTNQTRILLSGNVLESYANSYYFGNNVSRRIMYMDSSTVAWTANTYKFGDPNGTTLVFKMDYVDADQSQTWSHRSAGNKRIDFQFGELGRNRIAAKDENNNRILMELVATEVEFATSQSTGNLQIGGATSMNNRPMIRYWGGNCGITFGQGEEVRMTSVNGGAYVDARAARWLTPSDMAFKSSVEVVEDSMKDKMRSLKVYDYDREPHVEVSAKDRRALEKAGMSRKKRHRGMSAQEIQKVMPEVVVADEDGDSGLAVDLYGLLSNTIKALNELQDEVDDLKAQLASK